VHKKGIYSSEVSFLRRRASLLLADSWYVWWYLTCNINIYDVWVVVICSCPVALWPISDNGLLILEVSRSHTTAHHSRQDSPGRAISSSQRPISDNIQHSRQTPMSLAGFEPAIPGS